MMAILMAVILTATALLDYIWDDYADRFKNPKSHKRIKESIVGFLLLIGWILAGIQFNKDKQSDTDTEYVKSQLTLANVSLTNATLTIKGMNDGGDSYAEPTIGYADATNSLTVGLSVNGEYPLRNVSVSVLNETKRILGDQANPRFMAPSETVFERYLGDLSFHWWNHWGALCNVKLDPTVTNYVRVNINTMNGFSWQIYEISKDTNHWGIRLHYQYRRVQEKLTIYPTNMSDKILMY
jgi:hypothetical protein